MTKLHLALKEEYFKAIKAGTKPEEYRLANDYWRKRLIVGGPKGVLARSFEGIVLTWGYPKAGDPERTIELPWRGWTLKTITHPLFGPDPVKVFAIKVSRP
jgi:hypothetical protein